MIQLKPDEARVLGVLIEKAQTTPAQYPMSLNGITTGCNQKSNRDPILTLDEERVFDALETLRSKGLVRQVDLSGSRVEKFRHIARDALDVTTSQLVVLAELLLRGPQTVGELRGRATRMHPIEDLSTAQNVVNSLIERDPPLVRTVPPPPGSRAELYEQLLSPGLHPRRQHAPAESTQAASTASSSPAAAGASALESRVEELEEQVRTMQEQVHHLEQFIRGISE